MKTRSSHSVVVRIVQVFFYSLCIFTYVHESRSRGVKKCICDEYAYVFCQTYVSNPTLTSEEHVVHRVSVMTCWDISISVVFV